MKKFSAEKKQKGKRTGTKTKQKNKKKRKNTPGAAAIFFKFLILNNLAF
jgi:hypothetical protein